MKIISLSLHVFLTQFLEAETLARYFFPTCTCTRGGEEGRQLRGLSLPTYHSLIVMFSLFRGVLVSSAGRNWQFPLWLVGCKKKIFFSLFLEYPASLQEALLGRPGWGRLCQASNSN